MSYGSPNEAFNFSSLTEDDGWQPHGLVTGDFYRDPDNVCRGVTLCAADLHSDSVGFKGGFADGDYYRQPDETYKGITFTSSAFEDGVGYSDSFFPEKPDFAPLLGPSKHGMSSHSYLPQKISTDVRFSEEHHPRAAPADEFFEFALTTIHVETNMPPHDIGNSSLDFFQTQTTHVLTKVRLPKYAIKAEIFAEDSGMMCSLKVKVFATQAQQYAIEFQRRSGDTITFNTTFKKATAYFLNNVSQSAGAKGYSFNIISQKGEAPVASFSVPPPLPPDLLNSYDADITPLLNLCNMPEPSLQAEAAGSLQRLAKEGNTSIYSSQTFGSIHELLQSTSTEVILPTSCLLSALAKSQQAAPLFASENMLLKVAEKALSFDMYTEVQLNFSQAFLDAVRLQSTSTLSKLAARELLANLTTMIQGAQYGSTNQAALNNMQQAQVYLNSLA